MASGTNNISHLPVAPTTTTVMPSKAGAAPVSVAVPSPFAAIQVNGRAININVNSHSPQNAVDLINGANLAGVTAFLDRFGSLQIRGEQNIGGDATLRAMLGI